MPQATTSDITPHSQPLSSETSVEATGGAEVSAAFERYADELQRHALALVRSPDLAEDAVQHAFVNTISALRNGKMISHPRRWLHRCVHNACMDQLREETVLPIDQALDVQDGELPVEAFELRERCRSVDAAVNSLPDYVRTAFILREVRGLAYSEIAAETGRSINSVRMLLHRTRKQIIEAVGRDTALIAGPLLNLQGRYPFLREQDRPGMRHWLALRLDAIQAWLGATGERASEVALKPALAVIAVLVAATPVLAPDGAQQAEGGSQGRQAIGANGPGVRSHTPRGENSESGTRLDAPAAQDGSGPAGTENATPAPGSTEPIGSGDRTGDGSPGHTTAATSGAGSGPDSPGHQTAIPFQPPPSVPPPDGNSSNEVIGSVPGGAGPGSPDGQTGIEVPDPGSGSGFDSPAAGPAPAAGAPTGSTPRPHRSGASLNAPVPGPAAATP